MYQKAGSSTPKRSVTGGARPDAGRWAAMRGGGRGGREECYQGDGRGFAGVGWVVRGGGSESLGCGWGGRGGGGGVHWGGRCGGGGGCHPVVRRTAPRQSS